MLQNAETWHDFIQEVAEVQLELFMQGVPHKELMITLNKRLLKLKLSLRKKHRRTPDFTAKAITVRLGKLWLQGTQRLDIRNASLQYPGPQRRPHCAPGSSTPLSNVDPTKCKRKSTKWEAAEPFNLKDTSWFPSHPPS